MVPLETYDTTAFVKQNYKPLKFRTDTITSKEFQFEITTKQDIQLGEIIFYFEDELATQPLTSMDTVTGV